MLKEDNAIAYCGVVKSDNLLLAFAAAMARLKSEVFQRGLGLGARRTNPLGAVQAEEPRNVK